MIVVVANNKKYSHHITPRLTEPTKRVSTFTRAKLTRIEWMGGGVEIGGNGGRGGGNLRALAGGTDSGGGAGRRVWKRAPRDITTQTHLHNITLT